MGRYFMHISGQKQKRRQAAWLLAAMGAYAVYALTLGQSVSWHDGPELALTAWLPGASHAPGSPVHSLLGYLYAHLADEAYMGTNWLSVHTAAIATGVLACLIYAFCGSTFIAVTGALVYAFSFQVWGAAVITEVYSLGIMLLACALWFATRWRITQSAADLWLMQIFYL